MRTTKTVLWFILVILLITTFSLSAQTAEKRSFQIEDYGRWRSITATSLSDSANWISYAYRTPLADDTLFVEELNGDGNFMIPQGGQPQFSDDEKWVAYNVVLTFKEQEKLKKDKKPTPQKVELLNLATGEKFSVDNAASFKFSKNSGFLIIHKKPGDKKQKGADLILRNLSNGSNQFIGSVKEYAFNKPGTFLAYTVETADTTGNGIYLINLEMSTITPLDTDRKQYFQLSWSENGSSLATIKGVENKKLTERENSLIAFSRIGSNRVKHLLENSDLSQNQYENNMVISEKGGINWSLDGMKLFFGVKNQSEVVEADEMTADVDIWHVNDDRIQSAQMIQAPRDKRFTYTSLFNLANDRFTPLAREAIKNVEVSRDGMRIVGRDNRPYISDWKETQNDYYLIDIKSGEAKMIIEAQMRTFGISPDSKQFLFWKDKNFWTYNFSNGKTLNLTANSPISFVNVDSDRGFTKPPNGVTGWSKDGKSLILNGKFDLWQQPLDGSPANNLTNEFGQKNEIIFRYIKTDREAHFIDMKQELLLTAFHRWNKKAGFFSLKNSNLNELKLADNKFGRMTKAKSSNKYMYTIESAVDFPNIHISSDLKKTRKITDANPWQGEYKWGHNELVEFTNKDGVRLQAVLSVPDDYQTGQQLPMIVDFYEKQSHNLNAFSRMVYRDTPMYYKYVSNGYLVMAPDVHFNRGTTHMDMLECVEAATKKVIELGYADPERIGLHGHSFSGQGGAYISTKSTMFAAHVIGAAATNLVGDFNQLWKGAGTNQHRYDYNGQGRFFTNPYDDFDLYWSQSAVANARTMDSALLLLHGTVDGAVEWLQGVEFYNALRFNGKNVILLSYPGQDHHASLQANKVDFQTRMEQFYDHYLKGTPKADWMINGRPFLKKPVKKK